MTHPSAHDVARSYELMRSALRLRAEPLAPDAPAQEWARLIGQLPAAVTEAQTRLGRAMTTITTSMTEILPAIEISPSAQPEGALVLSDTQISTVPATDHVRSRLSAEDQTVLMVSQRALWCGDPLWTRTSYHLMDSGDPVSTEHHLARARAIAGRGHTLADAFFEFFQAPVGRVKTLVDAVRADESVALALQVTEGSVVLFRESTVFDAAGRARMLGYTHFRADRVALSSSADTLRVAAQRPGYGGA